MILIRILQKIFHLIGSLSFGTNQSCIQRNCLKDVNIVKRHILNPKMKIIKILQKRESTAADVSILKCKMVTSHDSVHTAVHSKIRTRAFITDSLWYFYLTFQFIVWILTKDWGTSSSSILTRKKQGAGWAMNILSLFFFYYVHAFMVFTFPVIERFQISFSITIIFLCDRNPV